MTLAIRSSVIAFAVASGLSTSALAGTVTSTLSVRVVVQPSCTVAGATLDFGSYTSGQTGALNGLRRRSPTAIARQASCASSSTAGRTGPRPRASSPMAAAAS